MHPRSSRSIILAAPLITIQFFHRRSTLGNETLILPKNVHEHGFVQILIYIYILQMKYCQHRRSRHDSFSLAETRHFLLSRCLRRRTEAWIATENFTAVFSPAIFFSLFFIVASRHGASLTVERKSGPRIVFQTGLAEFKRRVSVSTGGQRGGELQEVRKVLSLMARWCGGPSTTAGS